MDVVVNETTDPSISDNLLASQGNYYANVMTCLGLDAANPPLGDLMHLYHHLEGQWLVASPIHWQATHNDAMIVATGDELELTEEESRLLFADITQFFKVDGFESVYHDAQNWLLKIDDKPPIFSKSVHTMLHQSMMPILNTMDKTLFWQRLITELQMYLSSHPLNTQRQGNKLAINGLWFWGHGEFKMSTKRKIITDDELLLSIPGSSQINRLTALSTFDKENFVFIKYPDQMDIPNLQEKLSREVVRWYWNNLAYLSKANRWWSKLWR